MAATQHRRCRVHYRVRYTDHVLTKLLERLVKGLFVVGALALTKAAKTSAITNKDKHAPMIDSIERGNIGNRVRVDKDQGEVLGTKDLTSFSLKVALWTLPAPLLRGRKVLNFVHIIITLFLVLINIDFVLFTGLLSIEIEEVLHLLPSSQLL